MKMSRTEALQQLSVVRDAKAMLYKLELDMLSDKLNIKTYSALVDESNLWLGYRNVAWRKLMAGISGYDNPWAKQIEEEAIDLVLTATL